MPSFCVGILETLSNVVEVEANSYEDAVEKVKRMWKDGEIILNADDFLEVEFEPLYQ